MDTLLAPWVLLVCGLCALVGAHPFDARLVEYNLNINESALAGDILSYSGAWPDKVANGYTSSPDNWRALPTYTVLLDKAADGDPSNNDFFSTPYEWDLSSNQLRHGGDIKGFATPRVLDYIQAMGYRCIYFGGTMFVNMPWQADGYSALDFTLLDPHYGTLAEWRSAIDAIHQRGMYVMFDMTTTTMGDLIGVTAYLNRSAPFDIDGYEVAWKKPDYAPWGIDEYVDFSFDNTFNDSCQFPAFYDRDASPIESIGNVKGCYSGDFDQFGDTEAFGVHPDYQRQLTKFASVQDRLRDWDPRVAEKLKHLSCLVINALDPDAFRIDKALQQTLGFVADWAPAVRRCAAEVGKQNFFIPGEITGGNTFGSLYIGRGRLPSNYENLGFQQAAFVQPNESEYFMRPQGANGLDAAAFHYSVYRSLTRFLGMDGNLEVAYDVPRNWQTMWNVLFTSNDFLNANTGRVDPRHLWGTTNQDVFRWPSLINGTDRFVLGQVIVNLLMPGIPLLYYGEEQGLYIMDSTASNYIYGRQPMTASRAWQAHACYRLGSEQYFDMPLGKALVGCTDDWNSLDHFDPTAPVRAITTQMLYLRSQYAALQDGLNLVQLGNWTTFGTLPGSRSVQSEWGLWSALRGTLPNVTLTGLRAETSVWILYSNLNRSETFAFDCASDLWMSAPYPAPTTVRNLMAPFDSYDLAASLSPYYDDGKAPYRGCLPSLTLAPWSFKIFVPVADWTPPLPQLLTFSPGHDARILSDGAPADLPIALAFNYEMDCATFVSKISLAYSLAPMPSTLPTLDPARVTCGPVQAPAVTNLTGAPTPIWQWNGVIANASDGIYEITVANMTTLPVQLGDDQNEVVLATNATSHLLVRRGRFDNPLVFPSRLYDPALLSRSPSGGITLNNKATGADKYRLSFDYGQTWDPWQPYATSVDIDEASLPSDGHVRVAYWSAIAGSAAQIVDGDLDPTEGLSRRYPLWQLRGDFNSWGHDNGVDSTFAPTSGSNISLSASTVRSLLWCGLMRSQVMASWPDYFQVSPYGQTQRFFFGDVDGDSVLDLLPPNSQSPSYVNMTVPPSGYLGWIIDIDQGGLTWSTRPTGRTFVSALLFALLAAVPPILSALLCRTYIYSRYRIFRNSYGFANVPAGPTRKSRPAEGKAASSEDHHGSGDGHAVRWPYDMTKRRKVLIATLESEIMDWKLKVKIGGLGVMSSVMARTTHDIDLLWVVPKVGDLTYPEADHQPPISAKVYGKKYTVDLQTHTVDNVTYYLLDSPVFRANTSTDPYDDSMSNLRSAIFYSVWNQAIAEVVRRQPDLDLYHINDYHGALVPLYLLPKILPCALSLHNAEFQARGAWPLRSKREIDDISRIFNLPREVIKRYAQFGNVFNLLHAAATYISIHQGSVGVAGVSDAYGERSWKRYPALWTLKTIDSLPNPDPSDIAPLDDKPSDPKMIQIDDAIEAKRPGDKLKAQQWAALEVKKDAELFVFVGRWSLQKGVDLIADVFPRLLETDPKIQLIAVGPVVDLYGRLAAVKLQRLVEMYPGRVYSKPEFTALDEPFGLVAVEFGRKGALGIGSRLGGLGLMPGFWYPVESDSTAHLHAQFKQTILKALKLTERERAILRARSAVQRFPVLDWRQRLESLHARSIRASDNHAGRSPRLHAGAPSPGELVATEPTVSPSYGQARQLVKTTFASPLALVRSPLSGLRRGRAVAVEEPVTSFDAPRLGRSLPPGAAAPSFAGHLELLDRDPEVDAVDSPSLDSAEDDAPLLDQSTPAFDLYSPATPESHSTKTQASSTGSTRLTSLPAGAVLPTLGYGGDSGECEATICSRDSLESQRSSAEHSDASHSGWRPDGAYDVRPRKLSLAPDTDDADPDANADPEEESSDAKLLTARLVSLHPFVQDPFAGLGLTAAEFNALADDEALRAAHDVDRIASVILQHGHCPINNTRPEFDDQDGAATAAFQAKLGALNSSNSEGRLSIASYLTKAERIFFENVRRRELSRAPSPAPSRPRSVHSEKAGARAPYHVVMVDDDQASDEDEPLADTRISIPLSRCQVLLQTKIGSWPRYTVLLALGQCLSATSFQLALLGGTSSQSSMDLQIIAAVNILGSMTWYLVHRFKPSVYALSLPWAFFGAAFILIGVPSLTPALSVYESRHAIALLAECLYSFASSAGFLFFSANFGEEAGAPASVWVMRACLVQGVQQVWVAALWYFAFRLQGADPASPSSLLPIWANAVTMPLGAVCFVFGYLLLRGLPPFYRHLPGSVPALFKGLLRRRLVVWWMVAEVLRDVWLSPTYGRNWAFLWSGARVPVWSTIAQVAIFFIVIWTVIMLGLRQIVKRHSWLLPMVAIGLISPRWAQSFWGVSGIGRFVPWAGPAGPYVSTGLWLWLGTLDAIQGVGLGLMLLQTLSRVHVLTTLFISQVVGATTVMVARAVVTPNIRPSSLFPNFGLSWSGFSSWSFYAGLVSQVVIVVGFLAFFRAEQLWKP